MAMVTTANIHYSIGGRDILRGASLSIEHAERIGLVGRNGTGKSTLMKVIGGVLKPDSGDVSIAKSARIGYLEQEPTLDPANTLRQEAESGFAALHALHTELDKVFEQMGRAGDDPDTLDRLMKRQTDLESRIEAEGGYAVDHKIEATLHGLGFTDAQFGVPVSGLSGGQRSRLGLAKLLLAEPDLLLLDEPTNHLDIAGREWLETFLRDTYPGAVLMVSHDRYLLDAVVSRIEEVEQGRLIDYPGNYSKFIEIRAERVKTQHRAYENQQTKFRQEEAFIRKYKAGQRAKQARGRELRLEREKEQTLERPMEAGVMRFGLPRAQRSGELVLSASGASKKYTNDDGSERVLFDGLDVKISRGERWGVIGPNGAGKTTLVRAMLGQIELDSGTARIGSNVIVGYFSQVWKAQGDADGQVVFRYLQNAIKKENPDSSLSEQQARDLAGAFLFSGRDQEKEMQDLSGGERARVRLAALLASAKNLIVLDEPTNHLDIPSAERLEAALSKDTDGAFDGTVILISHDRALLDHTCDNLLILDGQGGARVFAGTYSEYRRKRDAEARAEEERARAAAERKQSPEPKPVAAESKKDKSDGKAGLSWMPTDRLEKEMEEGSTQINRIDHDLAKEEVYTDAARCKALLAQRDEVAERLEALEEEWLRRMDES